MTEMRKYAVDQFEVMMPGYGEIAESMLYQTIGDQLAAVGKRGMDFYDFRRAYKTKLQSVLENAKAGNLKTTLATIATEHDDDAKRERIREIILQPSKNLRPDLWSLPIDDDHSEGTEELREGTFACGNCARKGLYAKNTSHYEKQTRSADEPSTVFMHCHTCGKDYRFSS